MSADGPRTPWRLIRPGSPDPVYFGTERAARLARSLYVSRHGRSVEPVVQHRAELDGWHDCPHPSDAIPHAAHAAAVRADIAATLARAGHDTAAAAERDAQRGPARPIEAEKVSEPARRPPLPG